MHYNSDFDMKTWRSRTVETYKRYLNRPGLSPEEAGQIRRGIEELENVPL